MREHIIQKTYRNFSSFNFSNLYAYSWSLDFSTICLSFTRTSPTPKDSPLFKDVSWFEDSSTLNYYSIFYDYPAPPSLAEIINTYSPWSFCLQLSNIYWAFPRIFFIQSILLRTTILGLENNKNLLFQEHASLVLFQLPQQCCKLLQRILCYIKHNYQCLCSFYMP